MIMFMCPILTDHNQSKLHKVPHLTNLITTNSLRANPPVTEFRWRFNSAGKASELRNYEVHTSGQSSTITYV